MKSGRVAALAILFGLVSPQIGTAIATDPTRVEVGDEGMIFFPVWNSTESSRAMTGVELVLSSAPSWLEISTKSFFGPTMISPGTKAEFWIQYFVGASFSTATSGVDMEAKIIQDSTGAYAGTFAWRIVSEDGLVSYSGTCLDSQGRFCGEFAQIDQSRPETEIVFDGPAVYLGTRWMYSDG